jgi:hypothetical protein
MGDGPYIYIPWNRSLATLPVNATKLLWEWEVLLDPEAALRAELRRMLGPESILSYGQSFVVPTAYALDVSRRVLEDTAVHELFEETVAFWGTVVSLSGDELPEYRHQPIKKWMTHERRVSDGVVIEMAQNSIVIALGAAVQAAVQHAMGYQSIMLREQAEKSKDS